MYDSENIYVYMYTYIYVYIYITTVQSMMVLCVCILFQGSPAVFIDKDDQSSRWLSDMEAKNLLQYSSLTDIEGNTVLCYLPVLPSCVMYEEHHCVI